MSSISKACLELSKSIKGFRFNRSPTDANKDFDSTSGSSSTRQQTNDTTVVNSSSATSPSKNDVIATSGSADSVTDTISRVFRSATNRVRSFSSLDRNGHCVTAGSSNGGGSGSPASPAAAELKIRTMMTVDVWQDEKFLLVFFRFFTAKELCVLAQVCQRWREVLYKPIGRWLWSGVTPIVHCKELPCEEGDRRSFYHSIELRGFDSLCLVGVQDADVTDMTCLFPYSRSGIVMLSVRCSNVSDKGLAALLDLMSAVTSLELSGCNEITESGLWSCLTSRFTCFSVSDCINVADDTVGAVAQLLPALRELNLQAYHVTDSALTLFSAKQSGSLRVLRLQSCWEITNHGVVNVIRCLPALTVLSLSGCSKITDDGVEVIAENLRQLKSLDLSWCSRITDAALEYIACDLGQLEELTLDRCCHVSDIGIGYLSTMTSLSHLFLRWCTQLRDFGLQHLYTMKNLRVLSLAGCSLLTPAGLTGLVQLSSLKELELTNCSVTATTDVCSYLRQSMPNCVIID